MDTVTTKLTRCFSLAFPSLPAESIPAASVQTVPEWDSIAQITLLTLIGEEFGLQVDFEEFEDALSFEQLSNRLRSQD
jgi:acyl carrier protein